MLKFRKSERGLNILLNDKRVGSIKKDDGLYDVELWKDCTALDASASFGKLKSAKAFVRKFYRIHNLNVSEIEKT